MPKRGMTNADRAEIRTAESSDIIRVIQSTPVASYITLTRRGDSIVMVIENGAAKRDIDKVKNFLEKKGYSPLIQRQGG